MAVIFFVAHRFSAFSRVHKVSAAQMKIALEAAGFKILLAQEDRHPGGGKLTTFAPEILIELISQKWADKKFEEIPLDTSWAHDFFVGKFIRHIYSFVWWFRPWPVAELLADQPQRFISLSVPCFELPLVGAWIASTPENALKISPQGEHRTYIPVRNGSEVITPISRVVITSVTDLFSDIFFGVISLHF